MLDAEIAGDVRQVRFSRPILVQIRLDINRSVFRLDHEPQIFVDVDETLDLGLGN